MIDKCNLFEWDAKEAAVAGELIAGFSRSKLARRANPIASSTVIAYYEVTRFASGRYPGAALLRQILNVFRFDEIRICSYRLEHKLLQALLINHYAPGSMPETFGANAALSRHEGVNPDNIIQMYYNAGFFVKAAMGEASGELAGVDQRVALQADIQERGIRFNAEPLDEVYVFQRRIEIDIELRIHSFQDEVVPALTFFRYSHGEPDPHLAAKANAFVQSVLDRLPNELVRDSLYGWDVSRDKDGVFTVIELNPTGMHKQFNEGFHCSGFFQVPAWSAVCLGRLCLYLRERYRLDITLRPSPLFGTSDFDNLYRLVAMYIAHRVRLRRLTAKYHCESKPVLIPADAAGYASSMAMNTIAWIVAEGETLDVPGDVRSASALSATGRSEEAAGCQESASVMTHPGILQMIEQQALQHPDRIALVYGRERLSYQEVLGWVTHLADLLSGQGVGPGSCVGVLMDRGLPLIPVLLAILSRGAYYVPLDPEWRVQRVRRVLADCGPCCLVITGDLQEMFHEMPELKSAYVVKERPQAFKLAVSTPPKQELPDPSHQLCYVLYTSGSTGEPKGVMIEHQSVMNQLRWMQDQYGLTASDTVLFKTPHSFDVAIWEMFWPLMSGACIAIAPAGAHKDPYEICRLIDEHLVTAVQFVPTMLHQFVECDDAARIRSLRQMFSIGEPLSSRLAVRAMTILPEVALHNLYGPTETTIAVTAWDCRRGCRSDPVSIGTPISNVPIYILDECGVMAKNGEIGEIYVGGIQVARGYSGGSPRTGQSFVADPYSLDHHKMMYATGDLGLWGDDGALRFCGRKDNQIKLHGKRLEPGEIEALLDRQRGICHSVVTKVEGESGSGSLVAFVVVDEALFPSGAMADLAHALSLELEPHMIPRLFIKLDEIPTTPTGKRDMRLLDALAKKRVEEEDSIKTRDIALALGNGFAHNLGREAVDSVRSLTELGLDSLSVLRLANRIRSEYGAEIDLAWLFSNEATLDAIARLLHRGVGATIG